MKLLYVSDFHGQSGHHVRLARLSKSLRPEVIILGGDMLPDDSALEPEQMGVGQPTFVRQQFRRTLVELREASACREILVIFGNHDWASSAEAMKELAADGLATILTPDRPHVIEGVSFVGYSCTPPTPWYVKDFERLDAPGDAPPLLGGARWDGRFNRVVTHGAKVLFEGLPTMEEELAAMPAIDGPWVFVAHAPPKDTRLDQGYGPRAMGSRAIRSVIQRRRPLLSLHGHIHESPKVTNVCHERLDETVAINPGQSDFQTHYAVVEWGPGARRVSHVEIGRTP